MCSPFPYKKRNNVLFKYNENAMILFKRCHLLFLFAMYNIPTKTTTPIISNVAPTPIPAEAPFEIADCWFGALIPEAENKKTSS
jgi:hypothetical protein